MSETTEYFTWETTIDGKPETLNFLPAGELTVGVFEEAAQFPNQSKGNFYIFKKAARTTGDYSKLLKLKQKEFGRLMVAWNELSEADNT